MVREYGRPLVADWLGKLDWFPHPLDGSLVATVSGNLTSTGSSAILLHGLGNGGGVFAPLLPAVQKLTGSVFAPTVPVSLFEGSHETNRPSVEPLIKWLSAIVEPPWTLVGHSMGGVVAGALVREFPERVSGCVLLSAPLPALMERLLDRPRADRMGRALIMLELLAGVSSVVRPGLPGRLAALEIPLARTALKGFISSPSALDDNVIAKAVLDSRTRDGRRQLQIARSLPGWFHEPCDFSTLEILIGSTDPLIADDDYDLIQKTYGRAKVRIVEDAAHFLHLERPDAVIESIESVHRRQ